MAFQGNRQQQYGQYPQQAPSSYPPPQGPAGYPPPQGPAVNYQSPYNYPNQGPVLPAATEPMVLQSLRKPVGFDPESLQDFGYASTVVRNGFIRKVFAIVSLQLLLTVACATAFYKQKDMRSYVLMNRWVFWAAWGAALICILVLSFSNKARRVYPYNIIMLSVFTICEAVLIGVITARYESRVVLMAFAVTAAVVVSVTLFACQTKWDITSRGGILLVLLVVLFVLMIIGIFWVNKVYHLVIAGFGAILFTFYLMYDIQLLMGNRQYSMSPDEYVFAALTIYIDIINIFQFILSLIGLSSSMN